MYYYTLSLMEILKSTSLKRSDIKREDVEDSGVACSVKMAINCLLKEFLAEEYRGFYQSAASKWGVIVG